MKKNISINLQGLIFHIEEDGYEVLGRYLAEVKAHFATFRGHQDIVADIEGRIAELFSARLSTSQQVITLADVNAMVAKMGRVSDFAIENDEEDETEAGPTASGSAFGAEGPYATKGPVGSAPAGATGEPRRLFRDMAHRKIAGVAAGLAQYFAVNPLWVRLGFVAVFLFKPFLRIGHTFDFDNPVNLSGFAVLLYVILWVLLPKRYDAPNPDDIAPGHGPLAGRRLFRDTDTAKIGGVAAGLAHYFNLDVTLVRVVLLAGLFAGGFTFILYIILWIVAPEAKTVSEKMQMRGEGVTLSGIDNNLRATALDADGLPIAPTGGRPVGAFLEGAARGARPAVSFLGTLIRWGVGALLIFIGGSMLFGLLTTLGVVAGLLPSTSLGNKGGEFHFDNGSSAQNFAAVLHNVQPWAAVVALLAAGIPVLALVLLGLRLLLRRPVLGRTASLSLLGLWLVGVAGTAAAAGQLMREFRTRGSVVTTRNLAPVAGRGLVLAVRDDNDDDFFESVRLRLAPADSGRAPFVEQEVQARGISAAAARQAAAAVQYNLTQKDSVLTLDRGFTLANDAPFRNQKVTLILHLPLDKNYRLTKEFIDRLNDDDFQGNHRPDGDQPHRARLLRSGRFQCLDCTDSSAGDNASADDQSDNASADDSGDASSSDDSGDSNSGVHLNYGGAPSFDTELGSYGSARRSFNESGFTQVNVAGGYRVVVRHADAFKIEAGGDEDELNDLRVERDGNTLEIKPRNTAFFGRHWGRNEEKVLVRIDMPAVDGLELAGNVQADLGGFDRQDRLRVQQAGVSHLRLNGNYGTLKLSLAGPCRTTATGHADELSLDAAGAAELAGANLQTRTAHVSLVGACKARLNVSEALTGEAVGASEVAYSGQPKSVSVKSIGASSLRRL